MAVDLILGTAGHIDHGKTALVKALTGVDTDRLAEEKRRGITIELGFAELTLGDCRLGIVDVPGHERFVRNMLAGATGIDLALLVVAADEAIKPQTEEHLEILRLLDLEGGVIALSKCDLAEPDWIELVEDEVRRRVAGTFLETAPIVRTSAATGEGLEELRRALAAAATAAGSARHQPAGGPFRMAIDRAFTIAGHGTVVTGSVSSGAARVGDELVVEPGAVKVRVRGLENHGRAVGQVHRGQRAAINLAGMHHGEFDRGHELATPGHLVPSRRLSVRLNLLASAPRPLKSRAQVRLHVGTAELLARLVLLDREALASGETTWAQLYLGEPAVTTWGQPFVLRSQSPVVTLGGGHVLDPDAPKLRRRQGAILDQLANLSHHDPAVRAAAAIFFAGYRRWRPEDLARTAGLQDPQPVVARLVERGTLVELAVSPSRTIRLHRRVLDNLAQRIERTLEKMHTQEPLKATLQRAKLVSRFGWLDDRPLVEAVLERMAAAGRIVLGQSTVGLAGRGPRLSKNERQLFDRIVALYRQAEFHPPTVPDVKAGIERNQHAVGPLIELAAAEGLLVRVSADYYLHAEVEQRLRRTLTQRLAGGEGLSVSQIRDLLDTTRKYAVPLCEYLDSIGLTRREGDLRVLGDRA